MENDKLANTNQVGTPGDNLPTELTPEQLEAQHKKEIENIKKDNEAELEKVKKEGAETVTVSKKALDDILKKLERLESAADVGRLGNYDAKNKKDLPTIVLINVWDGKVIVGWKTIKDDVQKVNGIWREFQLIQLIFADGTTHDLPYLQWVQEVVKVDSTIVSRTKEEDGNETLKVRRNDNGEEYKLDIRFVN